MSKIALSCTICLNRNYLIDSNKTISSTRFETNKYCKKCGRHTLHRETK